MEPKVLTLTNTQKTGMALWNDKVRDAETQKQLIINSAKAFLKECVKELGEDPELNWRYDEMASTMTLEPKVEKVN